MFRWVNKQLDSLCTPIVVATILAFNGGLPVRAQSAETTGIDQPTAEQTAFFESKIRPVLVKECYGCHSDRAGNVRGGLRLDTAERSRMGGGSGPGIVPGELDESLVWTAMNYEDFEMPPNRKLPASVLADFRTWIEMGAPDPRKNQIGEIRSSITDEDIQEARETFWAYQPPRAVEPAAVRKTDWPQSVVDRHVLASLEEHGLTPAADAEAHVVVRRLCYDLIGLPPRPDQISRFEHLWKVDASKAVAWVVDQLLERDEFGERWGRHWLDVVRYGESTGREVNMTFPHAWRYRDYVIDSFNADRPFDEFVAQQIAGDLIPAKSDEQWSENLVATTFLAIGSKNLNEQNRIQFAADLVDEQIDATTRVFLGTSVACARCHDHKFDPIPQDDYYALAGIFASTKTYFGNPSTDKGSFRLVQQRQSSSLLRLPIDDPNPFDREYSPSELGRLRESLDEKIQEAASIRRNGMGGAAAGIRAANEIAELASRLAIVDDQGRSISYCMGVQDRLPATDAKLLVRGEIDQSAHTVRRGFPQALANHQPSLNSRESGRRDLADWIASANNPLTARVMVNRVWKYLLGQGLVTTMDDFGMTGSPPSHPALLDQLTIDFIESDWSVKSLVKQIATSRIYRTSSRFDQHAHEVDPDNALLWRVSPKRLEAEAIRDSILAIGGTLDSERPRGSEVARAGYVRVRNGVLKDPRQQAREMMQQQFASARRSRGSFGRSGNDVRRQISDMLEKSMSQLDMVDATYRSVYLPIVRDETPRSLDVFDFADSNSVIGQRETSNTANQGLFMLNNELVLMQSEAFAQTLIDEATGTRERIKLAFLKSLGRTPNSSETNASLGYLASLRTQPELTRWTAFCQSLFSTAEFRYLD